MDQWTPRVTARAELAELLLGPHLARAEAAGLSPDELGRLSQHGRAAAAPRPRPRLRAPSASCGRACAG
jgi:hypothetical protein